MVTVAIFLEILSMRVAYINKKKETRVQFLMRLIQAKRYPITPKISSNTTKPKPRA
jgi:hypothetical protein